MKNTDKEIRNRRNAEYQLMRKSPFLITTFQDEFPDFSQEIETQFINLAHKNPDVLTCIIGYADDIIKYTKNTNSNLLNVIKSLEDHPECARILINKESKKEHYQEKLANLRARGLEFPLILEMLVKYGNSAEAYLDHIDYIPKTIPIEEMVKLTHEEPFYAALFMSRPILIDTLLRQGIGLQHIKNIVMPHLKTSLKTLDNLDVLLNSTKSLNAPNLILGISQLSEKYLGSVYSFLQYPNAVASLINEHGFETFKNLVEQSTRLEEILERRETNITEEKLSKLQEKGIKLEGINLLTKNIPSADLLSNLEVLITETPFLEATNLIADLVTLSSENRDLARNILKHPYASASYLKIHDFEKFTQLAEKLPKLEETFAIREETIKAEKASSVKPSLLAEEKGPSALSTNTEKSIAVKKTFSPSYTQQLADQKFKSFLNSVKEEKSDKNQPRRK